MNTLINNIFVNINDRIFANINDIIIKNSCGDEDDEDGGVFGDGDIGWC